MPSKFISNLFQKAGPIYRAGFYLYSMKKCFILILILFISKIAHAQQELLAFDEHNKYIFYQVIEMPGLNADSLHTRGLDFLKTISPKLKFKSTTSNLNVVCSGKFVTYSGLSLLKHETGEIDYALNVEFKDQKYRFWITDFIFTPYERDRYGNFVPKLGIEIPLETASAKLEKKELEVYLNETGVFCKQFGDRLKIYLQNLPKKEENIKKVVTDKW